LPLLHETDLRWGKWLFRWRSYVPVLFLVIMLPGLLTFSYPRNSHRLDLLWEMICLAVSLLGLAVRCYTLGTVPSGTSGRNVTVQVAESLNTTGIYSVLRNPLYLGNFFMVLGLAMFVRSGWVCLVYVLFFWLFYEKIILMEEEFLIGKHGQRYLDWAAITPAFIPNLKLWQKPSLRFSFRTVLKKEYGSLFGMIASFMILETISEFIVNHTLTVHTVWIAIFVFGFVQFLVLRTLKKKSHLLDVEGR
jgi:protein-S-isoprenylcysteine O-methyltransferase Ste14